MNNRQRLRHTRLMCGAAVAALAIATGAQAQTRISIAPQPLDTALNELGAQGNQQVLIRSDVATGKMTRGVNDAPSFEVALGELLQGTGLTWRREGETFLIVSATDPQPGSAAGDGADSGTVDTLVVTAQKREEDIQDVPIAMSAFSQETLERTQIAGGPDLMTQVPNMTFTKTNFSSYSIQIRGIGTQAISATTDPAVAVAFNNSSMIRNRFFEQEFYDLERIEVLRGPQGTLYGRNATAGVVNLLTAKPKNFFEAKLSADVANYSNTRLEGMVNIPIVDDRLALRLAGAWTKRDGYVTNQMTGQQIDGRDLWSTRVTLGFEPSDAISAYLTWEHFEEDDDRLRSGKQLCKKAEFPASIGGNPLPPPSGNSGGSYDSQYILLSQGCLPASLYSPDSFQTPNGYALPYYSPTAGLGNPVFTDRDVYASATQSRDLRVIESSFDPSYRAKSDLAHLKFNIDLTEGLSITSETVYATDWLFSTQDFNRFTTISGAFDVNSPGAGLDRGILSSEGVFCDPQLGCSDRLLLGDLSTARSAQFNQEFRLSSDWDGPLNFNLGANFTRYDTEDKYYVFVNTLTMFAARTGNSGPSTALGPWIPGVSDNSDCISSNNTNRRGWLPGDPLVLAPIWTCIYIDPNPIDRPNDLGHNYFLSRNPYRLISYAAFGELYYQPADNLKVTAGLRYTVDKKRAPRIPSWLLAAHSVGYPVSEIVNLEWREPTGRLAIDWKPDLVFTDETMVYASYARGYKAGGTNPPPAVIATYGDGAGFAPDLGFGDNSQNVIDRINAHPKTFDAEFVDAYELGAKNTLLDGRLTLNTNLFYYDYRDYQISQIVDRSAVNSNFDAQVWGAELEADWRPLENLRFSLKLGYENTKLADGSRAIDLIDRTAGDPNYIVIRPFPTIPSNCILPVEWVTRDGGINIAGTDRGANETCARLFYGGETLDGLDPATVPNNGEGIFKDLSGNELPNAPHLTSTLSMDYTVSLAGDWLMTLHTDLYRQSEAWTRIFNMEGYDKLKAYTNVNFAAFFINEEAGWKVMAYVKNVFDKDSITGAFLNSDDTGLTTNVFLTEPRLYGIRITKDWAGGPIWNSDGPPREHASYPFRAEIGGGILRVDGETDPLRPDFIDEFTSPGLPFPLGHQAEDLDRGDARDVRLTYDPPGQRWQIGVGVRFGRTNGSGRIVASEQVAGGYPFLPPFNTPEKYIEGPFNSAISTLHDREAYMIADFAVGADVGLGLFRSSTVGLGVRYAEFRAETDALLQGSPDQYISPFGVYTGLGVSRHTDYRADIEARRRFEGAGPVLTWDASKLLAGSPESGWLDVEWSLTAGALFGRQKTSVDGDAERMYFLGTTPNIAPLETEPLPLDIEPRSQDITVPVAAVSLGLSYELNRIKVGAGYRWERYFDAIDGGYAERQEFDRTIDGPYFKLAVGFGG